MSWLNYDDEDDFCGEVVKRISNGEVSVCVVRRSDGSLWANDDYCFAEAGEYDDEDYAIEQFEFGWRETHWNSSDWADYYGCDPSELSDYFDSDD